MRRFLNALSEILGLALIGFGFYLALAGPKESPKFYIFHYSSAVLILSIVLGVLFSSKGITNVGQLLYYLVLRSPSKLEARLRTIQNNLEPISKVLYSSGPSHMKESMKKKRIPRIWRIVFNQLESKIPSNDIKSLLRHNMHRFENTIDVHIQTLNILATLAPSAGVLGTVMGLIKLLGNLTDLNSLGENMSLALITTLYGVFLSIVIIRPLISRLESTKEIELQSYEQALFWIQLTEEQKPAFYFDPKYFDSRRKKKRKNTS